VSGSILSLHHRVQTNESLLRCLKLHIQIC
jgi:hypothetical protein